MDEETDNRNDKGRFLPGWKGGPGRPKAEKERHYLDILLQECPPDVWATIVRRAVLDAASGNAKAREWLGRYLLAAPGEEPDVVSTDKPKPQGLSREMVRIIRRDVLGIDLPDDAPVVILPDNGRDGYGMKAEETGQAGTDSPPGAAEYNP